MLLKLRFKGPVSSSLMCSRSVLGTETRIAWPTRRTQAYRSKRDPATEILETTLCSNQCVHVVAVARNVLGPTNFVMRSAATQWTLAGQGFAH